MKKLISIASLFSVLALAACSTVQIQDTLSTIEKDIPGWWTGLKALETKVGIVLTSKAFDDLLVTEFKVNPSTAADIKQAVGIANQDVAINQNLLNVIQAQVTAASPTTP